MSVRLRDVKQSDLTRLCEFQLDLEANEMAATIPRSADLFCSHWEKVLGDASIIAKAILYHGELAGSISCFQSDGADSVGYWIGKSFWGQGIASRSLKLLLADVSTRPLQARVAVTNVASLRVLQKCGFVIVATQHSPGNDRFLECEEVILKLK